VCNLYSITTNQAAIIALFRVVNRYVGNLAPMPGVFPDYKAPIVRNGPGGRELATARWGMPSSSKALMDATKKRAEKLQAKSKPVDFKELLRMEPDGGTTNIRNVKSKHWTRWLGVENRCVVPLDPFSEFNKAEGGDTLVRPRRKPSARMLRRHLDQLGVRPEGQRRLFTDGAPSTCWPGLPAQPSSPPISAAEPRIKPGSSSRKRARAISLVSSTPGGGCQGRASARMKQMPHARRERPRVSAALSDSFLRKDVLHAVVRMGLHSRR
jgi:hypothetical protein